MTTLAEHVGLNLPPERALRAAPGRADLPHGHAQPLDDLQAVAHRVGHAFHDRPHQVPARVGQRQPDEAAPGVRVGVRRPFAGEVGQEEQPFAAGRRLGRFVR